MSEKQHTEEEPSIEEILDSIRQIISEDDGDEDAADSVQEAEEEPMDQSSIDDIDFDTPAQDDEVFDLTELVTPENNDIDIDLVEEPVDVEPEPEPLPPEPEPVYVEPELLSPEPDPEPAPLPPEPPPAPKPVPKHENTEDYLFTTNAEAAAVLAISDLVRKTAVGNTRVTLEDIVRAELKPLLKAWLDKHLPSVIERLVQEELERVSKRVLDE